MTKEATMKTIASALIMSASLLSAAAYAGDYYVEPNNVPFQGVYGQQEDSATRAQVRADLDQAKAQGLASNVEPNDTPFQGVYGQDQAIAKTRAQVRAELAQAKAQGLVSNVEPNDLPFQGVYGQAGNSQVARY